MMISIVIPTYKRGAVLKENLNHILDFCNKSFQTYEVIVVDDDSADGTSTLLKEMCLEQPHLSAIILSENTGQQNATLAGIRAAKYPGIVTFDDDMKYPVESILELIEKAKDGYDVVYGSITTGNISLIRKLGTHTKELFFEIFCHKPPNVKLTSYRLMNQDVAAYVSEDTKEKVYISGQILRRYKNICSIDIQGNVRQPMKTTYTFRKLCHLFLAALSYSKIGLYITRHPKHPQYKTKEMYP
jgi:glycosyltransferase involved in cell wall biosynthesis